MNAFEELLQQINSEAAAWSSSAAKTTGEKQIRERTTADAFVLFAVRLGLAIEQERRPRQPPPLRFPYFEEILTGKPTAPDAVRYDHVASDFPSSLFEDAARRVTREMDEKLAERGLPPVRELFALGYRIRTVIEKDAPGRLSIELIAPEGNPL